MSASSLRGHILASEMSSASPVQAIVRQLSEDPEAGISNLQMEPMARPDPSTYPESSVIVRWDTQLVLFLLTRDLSEYLTARCIGWTVL